MASEEDFSLVTELRQPAEDTLEGVMALIQNYKEKHEQLVQEQKELRACRDDQHSLAQQFKQRTEKLTQSLKEDQRSYKEKIQGEKAKVMELMQEEADLMKEIQNVEAALKEERAHNEFMKQQTEVFTAVPERNMFFNGKTTNASNRPMFNMDSRIVYPMDGGTALVTFEERAVARKILSMKTHRVTLGAECRIMVEAKPVYLMVPRQLEVDSEVCPRRILISNLPKMNTEMLLNKLEIHFSKRKNGGGEVDYCEMLPDSWTVVLTFMEKDFAKGLTAKEYHEVILQETKFKVRVTPFLNGNITDLKTEMSMCPRTVLLTGIPDIMEQETLQDLLEIHFQKSSNGGGEIEAFLYNPLGQCATALFDGVPENDGKEGD